MYNRWLITGGCGFIGISLIRKIKDIQPDSVILVLDNLSSGSKNDLEEVHYFRQVNPRLSPIINSHLFLSLVVGDIRNPDICKLCCQDIDIVVHLAANTRVLPSFENPRLDLEINVSGTFNMLEAARQNNVKRFILASRSPSFDNNGHWADGQIFPRPVTPHEASKLACEGYCSAYFRSFGLKTISLCFSNVYGPGSSNKSSVISQFIRRATSGRACEIYGDGDQRRDFIFIDDLTDAIIKAALFQEPNPYPQSLIGSGITLSCAIDHKPSVFPWGELFHIASSKEHTINEATEILKNELMKYGIAMDIKHTSSRLGDVSGKYADTSKARKVLGWQPKTSFEDGLHKTVAWFLKNEKKQSLNMIQ